MFKSKILKLIRPIANSVFDCYNPITIKFFTRLRLELNRFREHKFKLIFQDTLNPHWSYGKEVETTSHFLILSSNYSNKRSTLLSKIRNINPNILENTSSQITKFFRCRDKGMYLLLKDLTKHPLYNNPNFL